MLADDCYANLNLFSLSHLLRMLLSFKAKHRCELMWHCPTVVQVAFPCTINMTQLWMAQPFMMLIKTTLFALFHINSLAQAI